MNSLFRKRNKSSVGAIPPTLANLVLFGNDIRKHKVVRKKNLVPSNKNELVIPYYPCDSKYNDSRLVKVAIEKIRLFRLTNFVGKKDIELLHIAQWLIALRIYMYKTMSNREHLNKIARLFGYSNCHEYANEIQDKIKDGEELSDNEKSFYIQINPNLDFFNENYLQNIYSEFARKILKGGDLLGLYKEFNKLTAFTGRHLSYPSRAELRETIKQLLMLKYPVNITIPEEVIEKDISLVFRVLENYAGGQNEAVSIAQRMNTYGKYFFDTDERLWKKSKISQRYIRNKVNQVYNALILPARYYRLNYATNEDGTIRLDSDDYLEQLLQHTSIADSEEGLTLPENISDDLANKIMEDADRLSQRHLVDYYRDDGGNHGKAYKPKFTPTNTIHKAVREIAKRNSDRGVVPKNMYRMTTDKKVFTTKRSVLGGSLLIDCSGSMGFTESDVREIIDVLPASHIAGYVGYGQKIDGYDGVLKIIAEDGRIDTNSFNKLGEYGYNSIDLESLQWLAQQPEPRIWVSDQQVVGVNELGKASNLGQEKREEILRFMFKYNIIPIRVKEQVKEVARQLAK